MFALSKNPQKKMINGEQEECSMQMKLHSPKIMEDI
jgi:hypothetical protein